jgi:predicted transcriptional regulator
VRISDSLYEQASQAARAHHVSVDAFIEEAVQFRLRDPEAITLTSDQMAKVRHAQGQAKAGQVLTMEQVEQRSATNRAKWLEENRP